MVMLEVSCSGEVMGFLYMQRELRHEEGTVLPIATMYAYFYNVSLKFYI